LKDRGFQSYPGSFSEFWQARGAQDSEATVRIATRRRTRERRKPRPAAEAKAPPAPPSELQRRIAEAEQEKLVLERRVADAFSEGDHREGSRAAKKLEQHAARLKDMYERWVEEEG
jgi:hypothetical protein